MGTPTSKSDDLRRGLPSVNRLLSAEAVQVLLPLYGRVAVRVQAQSLIARWRRVLGDPSRSGATHPPTEEDLLNELHEILKLSPGEGQKRIINATGIFLHTNLGRAPLPPEVIQSLGPVLDASCDLEYDLLRGRRSDRNRRVRFWLRILTGAENAGVVNNGAAALVLALATLARGREVVVSRGELVEIGGSFRIPDILEAAGSRLVEVGSTNRTRLADYANAIGENTALLLKIHPSNFRIRGFVEEVPAADLARLGRERSLPVMIDEGAGLLTPSQAAPLRDHSSLQELVAAKVPLISASGDKLLGGPQAGLLLGDQDLVDQCLHHPLYRAFRPDRVAFHCLEKVLALHASGRDLPLHRMWPDSKEHRKRLEAMVHALGGEIIPSAAYLGGGAAPDQALDGEALALEGDDAHAKALRQGNPAVVGRVNEGRLVLDLRTVAPEDDALVVKAVLRARVF